MRLRRAAIILLSVFTTEIGRRFEGVYAGPKCWDMLEGFLGRRCRMASLKFKGGVVGEEDNRSLIMSEKMGCDSVLRIL